MKKNKITKLVKDLKQFSNEIDLFDFGRLSKNDDIEPVRGLSLQAGAIDHFYAHGNAHNREMSVLARQFAFTTSTRNDSDPYLWSILRFELSVMDVNHIFIDAHHGDNKLYKHITDVNRSLAHVNEVLEKENSSFTSHFHVFTHPQKVYQLSHYLNDSVLQTLYTYYQGISFELDGQYLYVYSDNRSINDRQLKNMLQAGLWLSEQIEYADAAMHRHVEKLSPSLAY